MCRKYKLLSVVKLIPQTTNLSFCKMGECFNDEAGFLICLQFVSDLMANAGLVSPDGSENNRA